MYKIKFSENENKKYNGTCIMQDRNFNGEIIIYKDAPDKLKTLIHELIHYFLFEKSKQGYKTRILNQLNDDEFFIEDLAVKITEGITSTKEK